MDDQNKPMADDQQDAAAAAQVPIDAPVAGEEEKPEEGEETPAADSGMTMAEPAKPVEDAEKEETKEEGAEETEDDEEEAADEEEDEEEGDKEEKPE